MTAGGEAVRAYRLAYAPTEDTQPLSLLASVTQFGRDGEYAAACPVRLHALYGQGGKTSLHALGATAHAQRRRD